MMNRNADGSTRREIRQAVRGVALLLAVSMLLVAGCGAKEAIQPSPMPPSPSPIVTETPAPPSPTPTPPSMFAPLTGLPVASPLLNRPMLVTVENSPQARPQSGLMKADIVYEVLAEGEITRFLAIYQSQQADIIGPVRSMRPYFVEIGDGLDAVLVHAGWSEDAMAMMQQKKSAHLDQVYGDDAFYWRSKEREAPHNLYTSTELMNKGSVARKFRQEWNIRKFPFSQLTVSIPLEQSGASVEIPYLLGYKVSYAYDAASGVYKRTMAGKPHFDKETGEQLTAKNILIIETKHQVLDNVGRRSVNVYGPGPGYLLQDGKSQKIVWERKNGAIRAYVDGRELPLLPGQTWVQIVPTGTKTVIQ